MSDLIDRKQALDDARSWVGMNWYEQHLMRNVVEWLEEFPSPWIPVTERLPENNRNVLITSKGGVSTAWYNGSYFEKGASTHHRMMKTVTAWCELPEPYKGVTE